MFQKIIVIKIISISSIKPTQNGLIQEIQVVATFKGNSREVGIILKNPAEVDIIWEIQQKWALFWEIH